MPDVSLIPSLCIIQARLHSTRLPNKMLLTLGGRPLLWWAWTTASEFFGNVVIACPVEDVGVLRSAIPDARFFGFDGSTADVLGRFHACAHFHRSSPASVIVRVTPDDLPIDVTRERFTLAELDHWHATVTDPHLREHIGLLLPPRIEINTPADYDAAVARFGT